ncbi:MAG: hypothetical protein IJL87_05960 [Clostridia bacterium]|nr:hypothetical protein [Clostridia bacterium]
MFFLLSSCMFWASSIKNFDATQTMVSKIKEYVYFADRSRAAYSKIRCRSSRLWNVYQINFNVEDSGDLAYSYSAKKGSKTANDAAASKAFAEYCQAGTDSKGMEIGR